MKCLLVARMSKGRGRGRGTRSGANSLFSSKDANLKCPAAVKAGLECKNAFFVL
jgi:hypothetical protein